MTKRNIHGTVETRGRYSLGSVEENEDNNANMEMDVPIEETMIKSWRKPGMTLTVKNLKKKW